ncbi:MAG: sigma-54 dependent transcriptional regulator [Anaeromyxobacteraceae bacterium]
MSQSSVLVVDDEELVRWSLAQELSRKGYSAATAATGAEALRLHGDNPSDVVLLDINLPDGSGIQLIPQLLQLHPDVAIIMITSATSIEAAVESIRLGAWDYVTKPFDFTKLFNSIVRATERVSLREQNRTLRSRARSGGAPGLIAESPQMRRVLEQAAMVMQTDSATVLLLGETGVGKDALARHIHDGSRRSEELFLDINCAALPEALLESELFGYERGAFTDAKAQKRGLLELAEGGTVFLDEVADAPLAAQAKLLKVLEQRTFRRLGGLRDIAVSARVIAATNRPLEEAVAAKTLREDLYYRLKVFPIEIPPLRERVEDILPLARLFVDTFQRDFRKRVQGLDTEAERHLLDYRWPGNVRELRNVVERAMIVVTPGGTIGVDTLPAEIAEDSAVSPEAPDGALSRSEARLIREALEATGNNQSRAATQLGISRGALSRRMRRLGIPVAKAE